MLARYRTHLLIGLLAFVCAQFWNRWNIAVMLTTPYAMDQVRAGRSVITTDDASYLRAAEELFTPAPASQNALGTRPDLRAPGYRLWYIMPRLFLPMEATIGAITLLQCLLYAVSVMLLWQVFLVHDIARWLRWTLILLFAVMPTFHGFLFHTITEGVSPALSLIIVCCAVLASRAGSRAWMWVGLGCWSLLTVTRPALVWVGPALIPVLWTDRRSALRLAAIVALVLSPTAIWWLRNTLLTGEFVGLHPLYHTDEPGITRPTHGAFWELAKSWGVRGEAFHSVMEPAYQSALMCDTPSVHAERFLALAPVGSVTLDHRAIVLRNFRAWQRFTCSTLAPAMASEQGTVRGTQPEEQRILNEMAEITSSWRSDHFLFYHVLSPLRVMKQLVAHSNLNLNLFQHKYRGSPPAEIMRWASAALHILLMLCVLLGALLPIQRSVRIAALFSVLYILYLAYVQRGVEERYTLPVLFIGLACAAFVVQGVLRANFVPRNP